MQGLFQLHVQLGDDRGVITVHRATARRQGLEILGEHAADLLDVVVQVGDRVENLEGIDGVGDLSLVAQDLTLQSRSFGDHVRDVFGVGLVGDVRHKNQVGIESGDIVGEVKRPRPVVGEVFILSIGRNQAGQPDQESRFEAPHLLGVWAARLQQGLTGDDRKFDALFETGDHLGTGSVRQDPGKTHGITLGVGINRGVGRKEETIKRHLAIAGRAGVGEDDRAVHVFAENVELLERIGAHRQHRGRLRLGGVDDLGDQGDVVARQGDRRGRGSGRGLEDLRKG